MTANVSKRSYTCDTCGKVNNNAGNHGRHVATHKLPDSGLTIKLNKAEAKRFVEAILPDREIPKTHGGYRPGSGRKPTLVGSRTRSFVLDDDANARFERFRAERGVFGASEALRRIIAIAVPKL
jgi:hypothetical protein